jgi:hypothetical protein
VFPTDTKSLIIEIISQLLALGVTVKVTLPPLITDYVVEGETLQVGEFGTTLYLHSHATATLWFALMFEKLIY